MNEVLKTIKARRGIKEYEDKAVPQELIEQIIEAGTWAPSGRNKQSPLFVVIKDKEVMDEYRKDNSSFMDIDTDPFYGAPMIIAVLANTDSATPVEDASIAIGYMMLAAKSLGLGSRWIHRAKQVFEMDKWKEFLKKHGVEGDYVGVGNMILGYPAVDPEPGERVPGRVLYI